MNITELEFLRMENNYLKAQMTIIQNDKTIKEQGEYSAKLRELFNNIEDYLISNQGDDQTNDRFVEFVHNTLERFRNLV